MNAADIVKTYFKGLIDSLEDEGIPHIFKSEPDSEGLCREIDLIELLLLMNQQLCQELREVSNEDCTE